MLYLIDASIYVFRAYYSMPDSITDPQGNPVHAVYGFVNFLCDFARRTQAQYVGVAFDISLTSSFRNDIYPAYKANREPAPDELKRQFSYCREIAKEMGFPCFADSTCEADDIIGTLATKWRNDNTGVTVVTRDKDLLQLVGPDDRYWDFANDRTLEYGDVFGEFGVQPEQIADYLALMGDAVDNIKGVPGIGAKTAAKLLEAYASLDDIYRHLDDLHKVNVRGAKTLANKLIEHREAAYVAQKLTQIKCDMPLNADRKELQRKPPNMPAIESLFDELGFSDSLRKKTANLA
ncbi:MAG: 5'-3' exonuclease H3TH domain-containing protein [Gammaproteobacteria bacterium]